MAEEHSPEQTADLLRQNMVKYLPYLREAQKRMWITIGIFIIGGTLGFFGNQQILGFVMKRLNLVGINLVFTSPTQFIDLAFQTGFIVGALLAIPYLIYCVLSFVLPALRKKERGIILSLLPLSLALTVIGFAFGVWIQQFVITIYSQTTTSFNISNMWDVGRFFSQFVLMGLSMALVFQLPIVLSILLRLGVIKRSVLTSRRRIVYAAIIIFATILPPTDILSLTLIVLPLVFLFEGALLLNK